MLQYIEQNPVMSKTAIRVQGPNLLLRLIEAADANYVYGIRTNPQYNTHLSTVTGTAEDQRRWIEGYKAREASGAEYYFVIERLDGVRCGLIRLYDIQNVNFTWGSWILDENKTPKAALESAILSFGVGFEILGCERAFVDVRIQNQHAERFYRRLGMNEICRTEQDIFFEYSRLKFEADKQNYLKIITGE